MRRLHVEQSMRSRPSLYCRRLWTLRVEQPMRSERPVHRNAHDVGVHVHHEQRLRFRRILRRGALRTRLQIEQRLQYRPGVRGGRLRRVHVK